jgi:tetratricopeptide (TPR) repeat protein
LTASVASFLTKAQKKGTELPPALSGALLLAAVRLSDAKGQAVRPYQLLVDDDGNLDLLTGEAPTGDGYAAPELRNGAVLPDDPRVLVYAAGALGYELVTLTPPRPGEGVGPAVQGPLGKLIRKAMADRQKRFKNLVEMARAIEAIQGRPTRDEEQLILAAVASSTPLPAAQKLAKIELEKAAMPDAAPAAVERQREGHPVFTEIPDPQEDRAVPPHPEHPPEREDPGRLRAELDEERKARTELMATVQSRVQGVAELAARLSRLEEQVRVSQPPPVPPAAALLRDVSQLIEQRRFPEAERALRQPVVENNALLQLRLGQALSSMIDPGGQGFARAEAAFRRAAELDVDWAEPRAQLGLLLSRQGNRKEARVHFQAALQLDPSCSEALAALRPPGRGAVMFALSSAGGAVAAALLVLALRPSSPNFGSTPVPPIAAPPPIATASPARAETVAPPPPAPTPAPPPAAQTPPRVSAAASASNPARDPAPAPKAQLPPLPLPEPESRISRAARPEPKTRARKVASGSRAAAEAEAVQGDKALRAFDTKSAEAAFSSALKLDPTLPGAHRGMGMVYVLVGKNAEAKAAYTRYLELAPDAPDKDQITRLLSR